LPTHSKGLVMSKKFGLATAAVGAILALSTPAMATPITTAPPTLTSGGGNIVFEFIYSFAGDLDIANETSPNAGILFQNHGTPAGTQVVTTGTGTIDLALTNNITGLTYDRYTAYAGQLFGAGPVLDIYHANIQASYAALNPHDDSGNPYPEPSQVVSDASTLASQGYDIAYIGWEDLSDYDFDYNDLVMFVAWKPPTTQNETPEPLTLSLFGAGLAGAAALRRRRKAA